jgi:hypothetical protein
VQTDKLGTYLLINSSAGLLQETLLNRLAVKIKKVQQLAWTLTYQCKQLGWSTVGKSSKQLGYKKMKVH